MIELETHAEGLVLPVRAQPGARRAGVVGRHGGALKVAVTEVAEKGKANKALIAFLAKLFRVRKADVTVTAGLTSAQKKRTYSSDDVRRILYFD